MSRPTRPVAGRALAAAVACSAALVTVLVGAPAAQAATPGLSVSEVAPWASGNSPYAADWFELTNNGAAAVDLTGYKIDDSSASVATAAPLVGVGSLAPGESAIFLEASASNADPATRFRSFWSLPGEVQVGTYTGSGLGLSTSGDGVNVFDSAGATRASVSFGASTAAAPYASFDNTAGVDGPLTVMSQPGVNGAYLVASPPAPAGQSAIGSPGTARAAGTTTSPSPSPSPSPAASANLPWPGGPELTVVDDAGLSAGNLSGLTYTPSGTAAPGTLWAVQNGPSVLFQLRSTDGMRFAPGGTGAGAAPAGTALRYPDGSGDPDTEGVTLVNQSPAGGVYVATERNNAVSNVSKLAVLRYDAASTVSPLAANAQWDLTAALPATGANFGLEAITWVPDAFLVAGGLRDSSTSAAYDPASYPQHGTGLFFVGVEGSGMVYGFALDTAGTTFHLVTSFTSGFTTVMETTFDPDTGAFWARCDNTCQNVSTVLAISPSTGTFAVTARYDRPADMAATMGNEGYAIGSNAECSNGVKPVYFADDGDTDGFSLRRGTLNCQALPANLPEFPLAPLALLSGLAVLGGVLLLRQRVSRRTTGLPLAQLR